MSIFFSTLYRLGFLREATRLTMTSSVVATLAPLGTGRQVYNAAAMGDAVLLARYLFCCGDTKEARFLLNWSPPVSPLALVVVDAVQHEVDWAALDNTPILAASWNNLDDCIALLASSSLVDVNVGDVTALHAASMRGNDRLVKLLLAAPGIDVNKATFDLRWSPFHSATWRGHAEVVRLLAAARGIKLTPCLRVYPWETPLDLQAPHVEIYTILTEAMAAQKAREIAAAALMEAVRFGNVSRVEELLEEWSEDDEVINDAFHENTALCEAATWGRVEITRLLVSVKCINLNYRAYWAGDYELFTALDLACHRLDGAEHGFWGEDFDQLGDVDNDEKWERKTQVAAILRAAGALTRFQVAAAGDT